MSEDDWQIPSDRSTGTDAVPLNDELPARREVIRDISLSRRQSHTIAPPRKWKIHGLGQRICPECRAIVPGIPDGFWHLQTAHNQGQGLDIETWARELRDEVDELIAASHGRRGYIDGHHDRHLRIMGTLVLLAVLGIVVVGLLYSIGNG